MRQFGLLLTSIALILGARSPHSQESSRVFAGWIVSAKGELSYAAPARKEVPLTGKDLHYWRLYMGDTIRAGKGAEARLLVYGEPIALKAGASKVIGGPPRNGGRSVLERFTKMAGGQR